MSALAKLLKPQKEGMEKGNNFDDFSNLFSQISADSLSQGVSQPSYSSDEVSDFLKLSPRSWFFGKDIASQPFSFSFEEFVPKKEQALSNQTGLRNFEMDTSLSAESIKLVSDLAQNITDEIAPSKGKKVSKTIVKKPHQRFCPPKGPRKQHRSGYRQVPGKDGTIKKGRPSKKDYVEAGVNIDMYSIQGAKLSGPTSCFDDLANSSFRPAKRTRMREAKTGSRSVKKVKTISEVKPQEFFSTTIESTPSNLTFNSDSSSSSQPNPIRDEDFIQLFQHELPGINSIPQLSQPPTQFLDIYTAGEALLTQGFGNQFSQALTPWSDFPPVNNRSFNPQGQSADQLSVSLFDLNQSFEKTPDQSFAWNPVDQGQPESYPIDLLHQMVLNESSGTYPVGTSSSDQQNLIFPDLSIFSQEVDSQNWNQFLQSVGAC
ncbi:hypothetical protein BY996DRAFT_6415024 [Phakopsora pachyrhizi]|nr:hypothetical protein BY996DRAFT_6415024 [Phakopsora pachyrhizi]